MDLHAIDNVLISFFLNSHSSFVASQQSFSQDLALIVKAADIAFWANISQNYVATSDI